jgi:predicted hotdog family 3-hydroxylacyl-ACP dehydratase
MCLLDQVLSWDPERIHCRATSHLLPANPLRGDGGLAAVGGVEYAAQAMALHAGLLLGDEQQRSGYLAGVRNLVLDVDWLHDVGEELEVFATRVGGDSRGAIYDFHLAARPGRLLAGRAMVVFARAGELA